MENRSFSTILGFRHGWDHEHSIELINQKILNLCTNKTHLNGDVIDGSLVNGCLRPLLYSFVSDNLSTYKVFSEPETILYKKTNKSVLNTLKFYPEDDKNEDVDFSQE